MIALDKSDVWVRGEALGDIWWRGTQWAVTSDGIECLDGTYVVEKHRLLEELEKWPWPRQLSQKTWCDSDEFATAFMVAIVLHGHSEVNSPSIRDHFDKMTRSSEK